MQVSDTTNNTGIFQDIDFICDTNSTSFPTKDKARLANRWYYKAYLDMLRSNVKWQFDDSNQTTLPILTTTLVDAQQDYELPSDLVRIQAVEVLDSGGSWHRLQPIDQSQLNKISDFQTSDGLPRWYDIRGNSIFLEPAPAAADVTASAGLKIYVSREIDEIAHDDTTQEPSLPEPFHRILSLGASYDWMLVNGTAEKRESLRLEIEQLRSELRDFNTDRNVEVKVSIKPAHQLRDFT